MRDLLDQQRGRGLVVVATNDEREWRSCRLDESSFVAAVWAILRKECRSEWRTRYGLNAALLFAVTTLTAVSFAVGRLGDRADLLARCCGSCCCSQHWRR